MLVLDLLHSCSNEKVADAAVACIGGKFAERVRVTARQHGSNVGRFVADVVRDYAQRANEPALAMLRRGIAGSDQPILFGLRHVVEQALQGGAPRPRPCPALTTALLRGTDAGGRRLRRRQITRGSRPRDALRQIGASGTDVASRASTCNANSRRFMKQSYFRMDFEGGARLKCPELKQCALRRSVSNVNALA